MSSVDVTVILILVSSGENDAWLYEEQLGIKQSTLREDAEARIILLSRNRRASTVPCGRTQMHSYVAINVRCKYQQQLGSMHRLLGDGPSNNGGSGLHAVSYYSLEYLWKLHIHLFNLPVIPSVTILRTTIPWSHLPKAFPCLCGKVQPFLSWPASRILS